MMLPTSRALSDLTISISRLRACGNGISQRHQARIFSTKKEAVPSLSPSPEASIASANDSTVPPSIASPAIPAEKESASPKHKKAHTASSPPRPLFPWRHELVPPPRLLPGTPEYIEAPPTFELGLLSRRFIALSFLRLRPLWSVVTGRFETDLATSAAYAFGQAVAGIVSNVYRIPFADVAAEGGGTVTFRYDPAKTSANDAGESQQQSRANTRTSTAPGEGKRRRKSRQATGVRRSLLKSIAAKRPSTQTSDRPRMYHATKASGANIYRRVARRVVLKQRKLRKTAGKRRIAQGRRPRTVPSPSTTQDEPEESKGPQGTYCSSIGEMVSPELRELYESAHKSGKDQLLVHLDMEPLRGKFISMTAFPLCNRNMAREDPAKFRRVHQLYRSGRLQENDKAFLEELDREGHLETSIELQVWVDCKETFSVVDRVTGAVVQGNAETTTQQTVGHLVRLEAMSRVSRDPSSSSSDMGYMTVSNWVVTDIDDLLGHKTWYHVLLEED